MRTLAYSSFLFLEREEKCSGWKKETITFLQTIIDLNRGMKNSHIKSIDKTHKSVYNRNIFYSGRKFIWRTLWQSHPLPLRHRRFLPHAVLLIELWAQVSLCPFFYLSSDSAWYSHMAQFDYVRDCYINHGCIRIAIDIGNSFFIYK